MAYAVTRQPGIMSPVNNDLTFVVYDSDYTKTNFKYIFEIFVNGSSIVSLKTIPEQDGYGRMNISNILTEYIDNTEPNWDLTGFTAGSGSDVISYYVVFKTDNDDHGVVTKETGDTKYTWNGIADYFENQNLSAYTWSFEPNQNDGYLGENINNIPSVMNIFSYDSNLVNPIYIDEKKNIEFFAYDFSGDLKVDRITISVFPSGKIRKYTFSPSAIASDPNNYIGKFGIGVEQINNFSGWSKTGSTDIDINDELYLVSLGNSTNATLKSLFFRIKNNCKKFDKWHILYNSKNGGWASLYFNAKTLKNISIKKDIYETVEKYNDANNKSYKNVYSNSVENSIRLNSDWLSRQYDIDNVIDMLKSPKIYLVDDNDRIYPAVVSNSNYVVSDKRYDKLVQYGVDFIYGYNEKTKR